MLKCAYLDPFGSRFGSVADVLSSSDPSAFFVALVFLFRSLCFGAFFEDVELSTLSLLALFCMF